MLERHQQPHGKRRHQLLVIAPAHRCFRQGQRLRVPGKGQRAAAMNISRNLVKQNDKAQRPFRRIGPVIESPKPRLLQSVAETHRQLPVKGGVLGEPALIARQHPEIHNGLGVHAIFSPA